MTIYQDADPTRYDSLLLVDPLSFELRKSTRECTSIFASFTYIVQLYYTLSSCLLSTDIPLPIRSSSLQPQRS